MDIYLFGKDDDDDEDDDDDDDNDDDDDENDDQIRIRSKTDGKNADKRLSYRNSFK